MLFGPDATDTERKLVLAVAMKVVHSSTKPLAKKKEADTLFVDEFHRVIDMLMTDGNAIAEATLGELSADDVHTSMLSTHVPSLHSYDATPAFNGNGNAASDSDAFLVELQKFPGRLVLVGFSGAVTTMLLWRMQCREFVATPTRMSRWHAGPQAARCLMASGVHAALVMAYFQSANLGRDSPDASATPIVEFLNHFVDVRHPYYVVTLAGGILGVAASLLTYPLDALQMVSLANGAATEGRGRSLWSAARTVTSAHGWRFWMTGASSNAILLVPYVGINWVLYSEALAPLVLPARHVPSVFRDHRQPLEMEYDTEEGRRERGEVLLQLAMLAMVSCAIHCTLFRPFEKARRARLFDLAILSFGQQKERLDPSLLKRPVRSSWKQWVQEARSEGRKVPHFAAMRRSFNGLRFQLRRGSAALAVSFGVIQTCVVLEADAFRYLDQMLA